jgi:uncharacterized protein (DUF433 family)
VIESGLTAKLQPISIAYDVSGGYMMTIMERIELNPKVCNGKPVIKGTRIPISVISEQTAQG